MSGQNLSSSVSVSRPETTMAVGTELGALGVIDLGVKRMILLSNSQHSIIGLEGYGITLVEQRPIPKGG